MHEFQPREGATYASMRVALRIYVCSEGSAWDLAVVQVEEEHLIQNEMCLLVYCAGGKLCAEQRTDQ